MTILTFLLILQFACGGGGSGGGGTSSAAASAPSGVIALTAPSSGSTQVDVGAAITVTFGVDINPATVTTDTFLVSGPDGAISGAVTYNAPTRVASFAPLVPFLPQTTYTVNLTSGIKDLTGASITSYTTSVATGADVPGAAAQSVAWNFRTGQDYQARKTPEVIPLTYFGMHIHRAYSTTPMPSISLGTWRLWDAGVTWRHIEPNKGDWRFEALDTYVNLAASKNLELLLPLAVTPTWASSRPTEPAANNRWGGAAEPANIEDWKDYVRKVATRYKGKIRNYEIWNEPNAKEFYTGSTEQMVVLTREAYKILKEIDPANTIVSPAATTNAGVTWLNDFLNKGGGAYADVIGYHFYVTPEVPESALALIKSVKELMTTYNISEKQIWNTEMGWASPKTFQTDEEAAAYVTRAFILNWTAGVSRLYWYAWDNHEWTTLKLTENDSYTLTPAGAALQEVENWLMSASVNSLAKNSQNTWIAHITRAGGAKAWIAWSPDRTAVLRLPKEWNAKKMRYVTGKNISLNSMQQVNIGSAPVMIEN